jgi:hypothetical protein
MSSTLRFPALALLFVALLLPAAAAAQTASLHGLVTDPSGALIPGATVALSGGAQPLHTQSGADGQYAFRGLAPGSYTITASANGFATLTTQSVTLAAGQSKTLNLPLAIQVQQQEVHVESENQSVSISSDQNASATVIKGSALDALSDDPDELQNELEALAGPAAGPNGGQIYIDGFEGGQIPPKSDILEIRVNQNPFSAEYDRIGYGRIEIITKPGTQKLHGSINGYGNDSAFNTANPFLAGTPSYYLYGMFGNISGPISKTATYFLNIQNVQRQNQTIVDAYDPTTLAPFSESFPDPAHYLSITPRIDFQITKTNFISIRDQYDRWSAHGQSVGALVLPEQSTSELNSSNEIQIGDTWVISPNIVMEPRFLWRRIRNNGIASNPATPSVTLQGAFTTGGAGSGITHDNQDVFMLQDYGTATVGVHTLRFGARARAYRDANYSTAGENGSYFFSGKAAYSGCPAAGQYVAGTCAPSQYSATVISQPLARILLFDGSLFLQDDWRLNPKFNLGLGLRFEGQNRIRDHADWAPRLAFAWTPGRAGAKPKTVIRAGYGWFFTRFTQSTAFTSGVVPYMIEAIHDNLINQQTYTIKNPTFYDPHAAEPPSALTSTAASVPTYHSVDSHFHAALDMQAGIGVDHQIAKRITGNITYLYTQGVHQYMSNNVTAPDFDTADYTVTGVTPAVYNYQFQSGGFYRQNQLIFSSSIALKRLTLNGNYVLGDAKSDTQGVNSFPSVAQNPGFDYGRAQFGIRNRFLLVGSYTAKYGIVIASLLAAESGTPYNLTIGQDLTGNNQFNARPAYGTCGAPDVVQTQYGCLDTNPAGKDEPIVPYGIGLGPANAVLHVRLSKVIGIGPKIEKAGQGQTYTPGQGSVSGRGLGGGGAAVRVDAAAPRRYNLTLVASANNLLNIVNRGTPNGVLLSPLFNQTQSLAGGEYGSPTPGTRAIFLQANLSF